MKYRALKDFVEQNRTTKISDLIKQINRKLVGMYNYYGISGNYKWMSNLYNYVILLLRKWLSRRSQRGKINWNIMSKINYLFPIAKPKITYHLW